MFYFNTEKSISPNIIPWWVLSCFSNSFVSYLVISEIKCARPLFASEIRQQLCVLLFVQRPGAWNKQEAQCFLCNLGYLYDPWASELWWEAKLWHTQALRLKNRSTWRAIMAGMGMFCSRFLSVFFNEFRCEQNQVWKLKLRYFCYCVRMLWNLKFTGF